MLIGNIHYVAFFQQENAFCSAYKLCDANKRLYTLTFLNKEDTLFHFYDLLRVGLHGPERCLFTFDKIYISCARCYSLLELSEN